MSLVIKPCELKDANAFIAAHHRHHKPVVGHRFSLSVWEEMRGELGVHALRLCGVAIVGRPVARMVDQRSVVEVTRLCTDGTKNACSMLYAAAARAAREMGYYKIQTYILESEDGTTLRAAGWQFEAATSGGDWNRGKRGGRRTDQPMCSKARWAKTLNGVT